MKHERGVLKQQQFDVMKMMMCVYAPMNVYNKSRSPIIGPLNEMKQNKQVLRFFVQLIVLYWLYLQSWRLVLIHRRAVKWKNKFDQSLLLRIPLKVPFSIFSDTRLWWWWSALNWTTRNAAGRRETAVAAAVSLHNLGSTTGDCSRRKEEADGGGWERETNRKKDISRGWGWGK